MGRICVASHHRSLQDLLDAQEFRDLARRDEFLIELRLDQYADLSLDKFSNACAELGLENVVVTYRSSLEGGHNLKASREQRVAYLSAAARLGVAYVDVELTTLDENKLLRNPLFASRGDKPNPLFIFSYHDFGGLPTLAYLSEIRRRCERLGADIVKIAASAKTMAETLPLAQLMSEREGWTRPFMGIAMGEAGLWSRVLGPIFPHAAPFGFARGESAPGTAPGQLSWRQLHERYRYHEIGPGTPVYGVIGNPIAHSLSPRMHNAALRAAGLPGAYLPFRVEDAAFFVQQLAPLLNVRGLSVTIPHKEAVQAVCAEIDPLAQKVGAINTLARREHGWFATNTDARAAAGSLEAALGGPGSLRGKTVLIIGAGGAARAVGFGVKDLGAEVLFHNRTAERAEKLAHEVGGRSVSKEELTQPGFEATAVVNTTPLGMHPKVDGTPLEKNELPGGSLVFDTVYNPQRTKLLQLAEDRGLKTLEGLAMFVAQGAAQFELFTGAKAPCDVMEQVVREALAVRTPS
ncbi:MAG: shikimate dehydrogenase [Planctomycetota bacterium]|nr:shikimate dehydrogenase [Planctomycetota bacterium]